MKLYSASYQRQGVETPCCRGSKPERQGAEAPQEERRQGAEAPQEERRQGAEAPQEEIRQGFETACCR